MLAEMVGGTLVGQMAAIEGDIARDITDIMNDEVDALKLELREQVTSAGLGARIAKTWRSNVYPKAGRSLNPAGYIWSAAPEIISSYIDGATIRPVNGGKWLWIPTKAVPRRRRSTNYASSLGKRSRGTAMTPEEVELHFNAELDVVIDGGKGFAFIDVVSGVSRGYREATAGRLRGRRGMAPRKAKPVLMFTLVKAVKKPRLLDLDGPTQRAASRIAARLAALWS
ncbi:DUF6441 family protein [Sphingobium soli]|uniref:DUF6441 family protein n=1 Tax=Sphingobium soli TaxID=1591116 RepID=A0ABS8H8I0_9SPHN|nr:DUF6441 family protein [Sphingobium soli]MCC4234485.1 DUF6441 family protein [Sphingobium soli]